MRNREFYFSDTVYNELKNVREKTRDATFVRAVGALESELTELHVQNLLIGKLENNPEAFNIHFLACVPRTEEFYPSEKVSKILSETNKTIDEIVKEYNKNLSLGRVYLGIHSVNGDRKHNDYTIGSYTECCGRVLYSMKWKKTSTALCLIDNLNEFNYQEKRINSDNHTITPTNFGLLKALMRDIYNTNYVRDDDFPDDTFYDKMCQNIKK